MGLGIEIKRHVMPALQILFRNYTYTIRNGLAKGLKRKGGLGFTPQLTSLTKEEEFLENLDLSGQTVYDIGGYIGITTLFFARAVGEQGQVITFEPNPDNYSKIEENICLNSLTNVKVLQVALGREKGNAQLIIDKDDDAGTGRIQDKTTFVNECSTSLLIIDVQIDAGDNVKEYHNLPEPSFMKIDVEGLEMDVLLGMQETIVKFKPKLFIEMHGVDIQSKIENIKNVVSYLVDKGYSIYHVESGNEINCSNSEVAMRGHIYCS